MVAIAEKALTQHTNKLMGIVPNNLLPFYKFRDIPNEYLIQKHSIGRQLNFHFKVVSHDKSIYLHMHCSALSCILYNKIYFYLLIRKFSAYHLLPP